MTSTPNVPVEIARRAQGSILGALIGDAAGAHVEFQAHVGPDLASRALSLPGGGPFRLAPGQITDDGELTICLLRGLSSGDEFDLEPIARSYADWIHSHPFDIGNTTAASLGSIEPLRYRNLAEAEGYAKTMTEAAHQNCRSSQANGSLMRATPLGVRGYLLPDPELARWASLDSGLSHPNEICRAAVAAYSIAIATLLRTRGDREQAFDRAETWASENAPREVKSWFSQARSMAPIPFGPHIGWVGIAFTHSFRHLLAGTGFREALHVIISGGGDTDTNACIAGGLIGAAAGLDGIPAEMVQAVLTCDTSQGHHPRPDFLHPRNVPPLVEKLLTHATALPH